MTSDPAEQVALRRYELISEAVNPRLGPAERGEIVRAIAARTHEQPDGTQLVVSRNTLDRWIKAYRKSGLNGLKPVLRSDVGAVRRHPELFEEAAQLRLEQPRRSAAHIADILLTRHGVRISERTLREQLQRRGLDRAHLVAEPRVFGRYEAERPNERWIGDVLVGPFVPLPVLKGSRRARLFLLVDDHSRFLVHGRWVAEENTRAGQHVLRAAIIRHGLPSSLYVDNGSSYANSALDRTCAVLGIRLIHSKPYSPTGRGKQERLLRVIRERFLLEAEQQGIASLAELNDSFSAWTDSYLNARVHSETGETPLARFQSHGPQPAADPERMRDAFRWSCLRKVSKTATISLLGNQYEVDASLCGRQVELRYDPEDLTQISVHIRNRRYSDAVPFQIQHHVHPQVPQAARPSAKATGIDYLRLVQEQHRRTTSEPLRYRDLNTDKEQ